MTTAPRLVVALIGLVVLASRAHGQDFEFYTNNGTITITRYIGPGGDVVIPDTINSLPVTDITFLGAARLTSIGIPNSVTNIALWIRYGYLFDGCTSLTAINVKPLNPAYSSRDGVLFDKSQTALLKLPLARAGGYIIPDGVSRIELGAFAGCAHLTSITIPSSLAVSNTEAFSCPSLTAINVDPDHPGYSSVGGVFFNKSQTALLRYPAARAGSYTIPDTVNRIDFDAFSGCRQLTSITVPPSVTSIGDSAFYECKVLSRIALPDGLISIGDRAFMGCTKLTDITIPSGVAGIAAEAFKGCNSLAKITVPDSVRGINYGAFSGCSSLADVRLPNALTNLDPGVFEDCTSLSSIAIPGTVTRIGGEVWGGWGWGWIIYDGLFRNCTSLTNVIIPASVTDIGTHAFYGCTSLTSIIIPDAVTNIDRAFADCSRLTAIAVSAPNTCYSSLEGVLFDKSQTTLVQYPAGKGGTCALPNGVRNIAPEAFQGCTGLFDITVPNSVTNIGRAAFQGCVNLTNVTLPNNLTSLPDWSFKGCRSLVNVAIPDTVTNIGWKAFADCVRLTSFTIGSRVSHIDEPTFSGCTSLTHIEVSPANLDYSSMDGVLFNKSQTWLIRFPPGRTGICRVPRRVEYIAWDAFSDCTGLATIEVSPENQRYGSVDGVLFQAWPTGELGLLRCPPGKIGNCTIPDTVTSISQGAFAGCTGLTGFTVSPAHPNWSSLDGVLFNKNQTIVYRCPPGKVGSYRLPNGVTQIAYSAFSGCSGLTAITLPPTLLDIYDYAFSDCAGLTALYFEGNAPELPFDVDQASWRDPHSSALVGADRATVYYLPGNAGWGNEYGGRPTAEWLPQVLSGESNLGVQTNQFGFKIAWASGKTVVVEAATNLAEPTWIPVSTSTLTDGSFLFGDAEWTNFPARFYRLRSP